jgi:ABC-type nitrate/sulfonate/bicarbonate transport system substrate-binding protein
VKRSLWLGGAASATLGVASSGRALGQTTRTVNVATIAPSAVVWPFMIAEAMGFYKRYGLDTQYIVVPSTAAGAQLLIAKGCDIFNIAATQVIETILGGADIKLYSGTIMTPPYTLVAQKQYKSCRDIKGKTIIVGGVADITRICAERIMQAGGVMPDEYQETYAGATTDRYAALRSGSVAAAILFPPWDFRALADGGNVIGTVPGAMSPFPYDGLAARSDYATAHPDVMLDFMKAELRAVRWLYTPANRARAIDILTSQTKTTPDDAARTYDELVTKYKSFAPDSRLSAKSLAVVIEMLGQLHLVQQPYPAAAQFFDNRYIEQAAIQLAKEPA